jgi:hypothetical protein
MTALRAAVATTVVPSLLAWPLGQHLPTAHAFAVTGSAPPALHVRGAVRAHRRRLRPALPSSFLDDLCERFQGDFDNYDQVLDDRTLHDPPRTPREGGGHEHIHCTLVPVNDNDNDGDGDDMKAAMRVLRRHVRDDARAVRLAAFYFDGLPERIFRFRLYALWDAASTGEDKDDQGGEEKVGMTLYSLSPEVEEMLRGLSGRPLEWVPALLRYLQSSSSSSSAEDFEPFQELHGCDVEWRPEPDPDRHAYAYGGDARSASTSPLLRPDEAHHAVMVHGEATIPSLMNPGAMIRVVDELSLWDHDFWINDRGYDPDTGDFVYGNQCGVPYKMRRVSSLVAVPPSAALEREKDADAKGGRSESAFVLQRRIDNEALAWTLGDDFRSSEGYGAAMEAIGGISARMNARPPDPSPSKGG